VPPDSMHTVKALLRSNSQAQLFERLAQLRCEPPLQIRVLVVGSEESVHRLVREESPFPIRMREMNGFSAGEFAYNAGDVRLQGAVFICASRCQRVSYLISVCSSTVWQRSILRLAHSLYPKLISVFFSQAELLTLLKEAKKLLPDATVSIVGHSRRQRLKSRGRRKYESSRTFTEKSLEAVFAEAEEQNYWFRSVSFEYQRNEGSVQAEEVLASATLSKYGALFCTSHFESFLYGSLNSMAHIAERKMEFFSNRSRRSSPSFEPKPISINYETAEFNSLTDTKNFVGILRHMPGVSCSVLHDNPYVHLSLVDSSDGSGAELWVFKNDEIVLVPQLKASEASLKKFVNYIFEEWREGSVTSPTSAHALQS
jgi:hypothetical protein